MKNEVKKEWYLDSYCGQQFAALLENGILAEFNVETEPRTDIVGNIYKGKVVNVLVGINAAFVDCGLKKNCYLSMDEAYTDYTKYDATLGVKPLQRLDLKEGDEIIVQVTKPPRGSKGAKVSTQLSFVGKRMIYLPSTNFLGISRKITDPELRDTLIKVVNKMRDDNEGFIIRTQAPFATQKQLKTETDYLKKLYLEMQNKAKHAPVGAILHEDEDLSSRVIRDSFGDEIVAIRVGNPDLYHRLLHLIKLRGDISAKKLILYESERSMMKESGISPLVYDAAKPIVPLPNGGSLVIEHTEAMTVIDVNSGSHISEKSLEETAFAVNIEAASEIARQVRLRNIGGIVVVDFIDMIEESHRLAVTDILRERLAADTAKCNVLPMSELCLTQFTRKRVGHDVLSFLMKPCPNCTGKGYVHEDIFIITRIRATLLDCFANGYAAAIVELNYKIMQKILTEKVFKKEIETLWRDKRVYLVPHKTYRDDYFSVRGDNSFALSLPDTAQILY